MKQRATGEQVEVVMGASVGVGREAARWFATGGGRLVVWAGSVGSLDSPEAEDRRISIHARPETLSAAQSGTMAGGLLALGFVLADRSRR